MIVRRTDYGSTLEITVGSNKVFQTNVFDSNNEAEDMSDENVFNTGKFNILQGDFTLITSVDLQYVNRLEGLVGFFISSSESTNENAGNWVGELEFINELGETIDQRYMNFNILQSN